MSILLLVLLLVPSLAQAAITYDAVSSSSDNETSNTTTWNHVVGGDYLVCAAQARGTVEAAEVVSTMTANSVAMTLARADSYSPSAGTYFRTELWVLPAPTVGTIAVVITWAGTPTEFGVGSCVSFSGVTQSTTVDASAGAGGTGTTASAIITTVAPDAWIVDAAIGRDDAGLTVGAGQTARVDRIVGVTEVTNDGVGVSTVNGKAAPGTETMDWTQGSNQWVLSAISLAPAGGSSAPPSSPSQATLAWTNGTDGAGPGVTGATIRRCTGDLCTPTATLTTIAASNGSAGLYVDSSLVADTSYCYSVNNFDTAGNQSPFTAAVCTTTGTTYRTTLATDTFTRADSTDLGASWDAGYTGRQNCQIVSGRVRGTVVASGCTETYNGVSTPNDQWVQFTVPVMTGAIQQSTKALVRWANATTMTGYRCMVEINPTLFEIQEVTAGTPATLATSAAFTHVAGDVYRCEAQGSAIRLYQIRGTAETLLLSATDATIASGKTGLDIFTATSGSLADVEYDLFAMGGFDTTPDVTPTITALALDTTGADLTFGTTPVKVRINAGNATQSYINVTEFVATDTNGRVTIGSDTFTRGDAADLGTAWTPVVTTWALATNAAQASAANAVMFETESTVLAANHWAQATLSTFSGSVDTYAGVATRGSTTADTAYVCVAVRGSAVGTTIAKRVAGVNTNLVGETTTVWAASDVIRLESEGSTHRCYRNGTLVLTVTDSDLVAGFAGLWGFINAGGTASDVRLDTFSSGNFTPLDLNGRYARVWLDGLTSACFIPIDSLGIEHTGEASRCGSLVGIVGVQDTTPPTLTNCTPTASIPYNSTEWTIACTLDKPASAKYDTTDAAYDTLANAMTTQSLIVSATVTGLTNNSSTTYYLRAQSTDSLGETHPMTSSATITVTVPAGAAADTTVPSTVANLVATLQQTNAVLQWSAATDNVDVAGYQVYQSNDESCATYNLAGDPVPTTTTQLALVPSTVYCWKVKAIDTSNNVSAAFSNIVTLTTATVPDVTAPSDMTNLQIIGAFTASLLLTWDTGSDDRGPVTTSIERCLVVAPSTDCSNFSTTISAIAGSNLSVSLVASSTYCFRGRHSDQAGNNGAYSNSVCGTTLASGLEQPRVPISPGLPREAATTRELRQ